MKELGSKYHNHIATLMDLKMALKHEMLHLFRQEIRNILNKLNRYHNHQKMADLVNWNEYCVIYMFYILVCLRTL